MSHYFYHEAFDFFSNDGNFGFYIEQGNGRDSSNTAVTEEYVIEVHYLGDAVTSLNLDVTNINHSASLDDLYYIEKGFIGTNIRETAQGFRYGNDGPGSYSRNDDAGSSIPEIIIQNGSDYWNYQQGGLDPIYGLIEIKIPNSGATAENGNRDHDYLYLESQLYFDVIQQDAGRVDSLQDLIDGDISLSDFAAELSTATNAFASDPFFASADASNDISGFTINEIPHMIHFDNVNYYGYDDFSAPVQLNTGTQITTSSETALIGEFRIDENADGVWSFDAEMTVWLNTEDRSGQYHDVLIPDASMSYMDSSSDMDTSSSYMDTSSSYMDTSSSYMDMSYMDTSSSYMDTSSSYMDMSYMDTSSSYMDTSSSYMDMSYMDTSSSYMDTSSSYMDMSYMDTSSSYMDTSSSYMDTSSSYMDTSSSYMDTSSSYMDTSSSYMDMSSSSINLNEEFINTSGDRENEAGFKLTISKGPDGNIQFTEILDPIDTLASDTSITFSTSQTFGPITIMAGTYSLYYNDYDYSNFELLSLNSEGSNSQGTDIYSLGSNHYVLSESNANGFEEFLISINNGSIVPGDPATMLFDDYSTSPFVVDITDEWNSVYYNDGGVQSFNKLDVGPYLVNVKAGNVITLTEIVSDTDYDGVDELANEYTVWNDGYSGYDQFKSNINYKQITLNESITYESADQVIMKIEELDFTWNSVDIISSSYMTDTTSVPMGKYKVIHDVNTNIISLQAITELASGEYDIDNTVSPYELSGSSSAQFISAINDTTLTADQFAFKQYFYDVLNTDTVDGAEVIAYGSESIALQGGTEYVDADTFNNTGTNFINTDVVTDATSVDAGAGDDIIAGGVGGLSVDGGSGFDMYLTTPASIKITRDQSGNITAEDGVLIDLDAGFVTYYEAGTDEKVDGVEYFMGTLGDDQFIGTALYSINAGYIDPTHQNYIQAFNPTKGKDEIFGAETISDRSGNEIDVLTAIAYDGMTGGQGVIFILDGSDAATYAAEGAGEISYQKISDFASEYWDATSWAGDGDGWLPSNEDIVNENGNFSTVSKYESDKQGATLILDSFGDTDLAFNVDHYIGSGDADIFFGSAGNDSFDAANGTGNYMSGGQGLDRLIVSDLNELESDGNSGAQESEEDLNLDSITVNRNESYEYSNFQDVDFDAGSLVNDYDNEQNGATLYRIDFTEVNNLSEFFTDNAASSIYNVSNEYALFLRTSMDLNTNLTGSDFTFDSTNLKIDVTGRDISVLDNLSGQLVLAEENVTVEGYIIQGKENGGNDYSTVIENVEQVSLLSNDINYFGTGGDISGPQEDVYQLITGGQGDLGEMLYVTTGENLNSTTGIGEYTAGSNFLKGEIFYSGHHTDFDRNNGNPSSWANSVATAFVVEGNATAKIWNSEIAQFFVWYDADTNDNIDGYEIAVRYQNGNINAWGIDNRQFDTFQNVTVDQTLADAINLEFGDDIKVELGEYRILYEAAYTDIETLISSHADVNQWDFGFEPNSSRSTFYIQVGGNATGENGSAGILDTQVTNVKVERVGDSWVVDPQAEILVNLPVLEGADVNDNLLISGDAAETIEGGRGSDVMMGRGGSDNYKISSGDTLSADGTEVFGSFGVAGDVINEIGGSSNDKSDSITLSSVTNIDQLTFSRTEIANEYWGNTLKIDVDYNTDGNVDDIIYVFDQFNQNLSSRQVEQLFLDDGWDTDEIWNLIVGDEITAGTNGQDILMEGYGTSVLRGGNGQDIMIGDDYGNATSFELGRKTGEWDEIADVIQNFGQEDQIDLTHLDITANELSADGNNLVGQLNGESVTLASISFTDDSRTVEDLVTQMQAELLVI